MAELDSDTLDTMVRLFIYFCHSIVGYVYFTPCTET